MNTMSNLATNIDVTIHQNSSGDLYYTLNGVDTTLVWPVTIINTAPTAYITISFDSLILTTANQYCIIGSDYITLDGLNHDFTINNVTGWLGFIKSDYTDIQGSPLSYGNIKIQNFVTKASGTTLDSSAGYLCQFDFGTFTTGPYTINNCINHGDINDISSSGEGGSGGILPAAAAPIPKTGPIKGIAAIEV